MKKQNKKSKRTEILKRSNGITLIAVLIVIIILIILTAVGIVILTGGNENSTKVQTSQNVTKQETAKEKVQGEEKAETDSQKTPTFEHVNTAETNPAGSIPTGATVVESDADNGIVIRDKNDNEWVWIEVPKSQMPIGLEFTNETEYSENDQAKCDTITTALKAYSAPYTQGSATQSYSWEDEWYEGCGLKQNEYEETYQKMIKSVYKNGGFWIGRYEAGIKGTTGTKQANFDLARTSEDDPIDTTKVIIQKDAIPYNYVTCSQAETLAKDISPDSNKTSSLLFGIQWDLVCKFLEVKSDLEVADINNDSGKWGNYSNVDLLITSPNAKGYSYNDETWSKISGNKLSYDDNNGDCTLLSTGASDNTKKLNIYDFAGNEYEWTLEEATGWTSVPCSLRGGSFCGYDSSEFPTSYRDESMTSFTDSYYSFRPALY